MEAVYNDLTDFAQATSMEETEGYQRGQCRRLTLRLRMRSRGLKAVHRQ